MAIKIINLEAGMPTVEVAKTRLNQELAAARAYRVKAIKIIHGYGSTGKGGAIRQEVRRMLQAKQRSGAVRAFVPGEQFDPFHENARQVLTLEPSLSRDADYSRGNDGITIVIL